MLGNTGHNQNDSHGQREGRHDDVAFPQGDGWEQWPVVLMAMEWRAQDDGRVDEVAVVTHWLVALKVLMAAMVWI